MIKLMPAFVISAVVTLAFPLTALAQNATDLPAVVSNGGSAPAKRAPMPSTFGTAQTSYIEVPANAFQPWNSGQTYTTDNFGLGPRWVTGGGFFSSATLLLAPLHLPSGAKITYLELDYTDTSATNATYGSLKVCNYSATSCTLHPVAGAGPVDCLAGGWICSGNTDAPGNSSQNADLTPDDLTVDNYFQSYSLMVEPQAFDGSEKVGGMIVGYVLQVSAAPVTASFTDVPTSYWAFQYIEALKASGITQGVTPTTYEPESNVTRAQMAVFLAKALGLQWN